MDENSQTDPQTEWLLPELPSRFVVLRPIGQGASKTVYLANDTRLYRPVAILQMRRAGLADSYLREARLHAKVGSHPNVVSIYDIHVTREFIYCICQFVGGGTLQKRLDEAPKRRLQVSYAVDIARQLCEGLCSIHGAQVLHRDLKPANVLMDGDRPLIGDFGISRMQSSFSSTGIAGTANYLAPELIEGHAPSPASDMYAIGCVMFEVLMGETPFGAPSLAAVLKGHLLSEAKSVASVEGLPSTVVDLVAGLLEKNPAHRPSAQQAFEVLSRHPGETQSVDERVHRARSDDDVVGQRKATHLISRLIGDVSGRQLRVLKLSGEAGIGKTHLMRWTERLAARRGFTVLSASGYADAATPLRPVLDVLRPFRDSGYLPPKLIQILDGERDLIGRGDSIDVLLAQTLIAVSNDGPVLVCVDDLHVFDSASINTLDRLLWQLRQFSPSHQANILVVLAERLGAVGGQRAHSSIRRVHDPSWHELVLTPLSPLEARKLVRAIGPKAASEADVEEICQRSGGSPLWIREICGAIRSDLKRPSATVSLDTVVSGRIGTLADAERQVLETLCVVERAEPSLLSVAFQADWNFVRVALSNAEQLGIVEFRHSKAQFTHPVIQAALYDSMVRWRREQLHYGFARYMRDSTKTNDPHAIQLVAHHFARSGELVNKQDLYDVSKVAGGLAYQESAWRESLRYFEVAIESSHHVSPSDLARLAFGAASACAWLYDSAGVVRYTEMAGRAYLDGDDPAGAAEATRVRVAYLAGRGGLATNREELLRALQEQLRLMPATEPLCRARLLFTQADCFRLAQLPNSRTRETIVASLALAASVNAESLVSNASTTLAAVELFDLNVEKSGEILRTSCSRARASNDRQTLSHSLTRLPLVFLSRGEIPEAEAKATEALELCKSIGNYGEACLALATLIQIHVMRHEATAAEDAFDELRLFADRSSYFWAIPDAITSLCSLHFAHGRVDEAEKLLPQLRTLGRVLSDGSADRALQLIDVMRGRILTAEVSVTFEEWRHLALAAAICIKSGAGRAPTPALALVRRALASEIEFAIGWPLSIALALHASIPAESESEREELLVRVRRQANANRLELSDPIFLFPAT